MRGLSGRGANPRRRLDRRTCVRLTALKIRMPTNINAHARILLIVAGLLISAGCKKKPPAAPPPPAVEVVDVKGQDVPIYHDWIGTLEGLVNAQSERRSAATRKRSRFPPSATWRAKPVTTKSWKPSNSFSRPRIRWPKPSSTNFSPSSSFTRPWAAVGPNSSPTQPPNTKR